MRAAIWVEIVLAAGIAYADVADHQWCRISTPSFVLVSDLEEQSARALVRALDRFRQATDVLLPDRAALPRPLEVVVFRSRRDFRKVFGARHIAGFMQPSLQQHLLVFGPDAGRRYTHRIAFHEYTHYLVRSRSTLNLPIWYEEGYASYLAAARFEDNRMVLGQGLEDRAMASIMGSPPTVSDIVSERVSFDWNRHNLPLLYDKAWGIVHFLHHGDSRDGAPLAGAIEDMLHAVDRGSPISLALERATGYELGALASRLRRYFKNLGATRREIELAELAQADMSFRCMDPLETRHVLASALAARNAALAQTYAEEVLQKRPDQVATLVVLSRALDSKDARSRAAAERALELDPADPDANVRMADLVIGNCVAEAGEVCSRSWRDAAGLYRTALDQDPERIDAAFGLGMVYLHTGQPGDAVNYLRIAYKRAPWAPRVNFYLGEAYRLVGEHGKARLHLKKTANWDTDRAWRRRADIALSLIPARARTTVTDEE